MSPSSVPLTVESCTVSQAPFFVACCSQRDCKTGFPSSAAVISSSSSRCPCLPTSVRPSRRQAKWSAVRNSTCPLSAATKFPVMTQDAVQFSGAVWGGSGRASLACLTGRRVTPRSGTPSCSHSNNAGKKVSFNAFFFGPKESPTPGVTRCTNAHSCWSDFCSPA